MPTRDQPIVMKDFAGLNRRDGGDKVLSNQFFSLQNWFPFSKGLLYKRQGTTNDLQISSIPLAQSIYALHRHYGAWGERFSLNFVLPDATAFTNPSVAPTLTDISGGDMFDGGAVTAMRFYYSWVGSGCESLLSPVASITVANNTRGVRITVPSFPTGVRAANVFVVSQGSIMVPAGYITTSGGSFDYLWYLATAAAQADVPGEIKNVDPSHSLSGSLTSGTYYIACCVFTESVIGSDPLIGTAATGNGNYLTVRLTDNNKSIRVVNCLAAGVTTNGCKYVRWFIGTKPPTDGPMVYLGVTKIRANASEVGATSSEYITIGSIPRNTNMQSIPYNQNTGGSTYVAQVGMMNYDGVDPFQIDPSPAGHIDNTARLPFVIRKDSDGTISEVMIARRRVSPSLYVINSTNATSDGKMRIQTPSKTPIFSSFLGAVYIANAGTQPLLQTDGYAMVEQCPFPGTVLPGPVDYVSSFKNGLIVTVPDYKNQIFGSNAMAPNNFASGGTGTSLRFVTVGDPYGDGVKSVGIFSFTSGTDGPKSLLMATKKSSSWIISNITDLQSGIPSSMDQLSGRVGCIAPQTMVQTPIGFVFLGNDGDVFLSRGSGDPYRIGGTIRPLLQHLSENDSLMQKATACYHQGFYKLSYPSSASSTTNDAQLWADLRTEQGVPITWAGPHIGISIGSQEVFLGESDAQSRYGISADGSAVVLLDDPSTFQDLGSPIVSKLTTKTFRFNAEMHYKRLTSIVLDAYFDTQFAHSVLFEAFMDDQYTQYNKTLSTGTAIWDSSQFDQSFWGDALYVAVPWYIGPAPIVGRTLIFQMSHSDNAQFILAAVGCTIQPERRQIV